MLLHITRPGAPPDARPYLCPPERGKGPASAGRGFCQGKETYTHPPTKAPRRITIRISIHAPIRGRPYCSKIGAMVWLFQSTPPYGGGDVRRASLSFSSSSIFFRERRFPDFPIPVSRCLFFLFASLSHLQDYGSFQIIGLFDSRENNNDGLPFSLYGEVLCCRKAIDNGRG